MLDFFLTLFDINVRIGNPLEQAKNECFYFLINHIWNSLSGGRTCFGSNFGNRKSGWLLHSFREGDRSARARFERFKSRKTPTTRTSITPISVSDQYGNRYRGDLITSTYDPSAKARAELPPGINVKAPKPRQSSTRRNMKPSQKLPGKKKLRSFAHLCHAFRKP